MLPRPKDGRPMVHHAAMPVGNCLPSGEKTESSTGRIARASPTGPTRSGSFRGRRKAVFEKL
jgi:hypothetical protein